MVVVVRRRRCGSTITISTGINAYPVERRVVAGPAIAAAGAGECQGTKLPQQDDVI